MQADVDALPMGEGTGLPHASADGGAGDGAVRAKTVREGPEGCLGVEAADSLPRLIAG